jgi:hypothetical protein
VQSARDPERRRWASSFGARRAVAIARRSRAASGTRGAVTQPEVTHADVTHADVTYQAEGAR